MGASLASLDTIINIKQLRDRMRTGVGECMSRLALITHSSNEFIAGDYDRIYFHHVRKTAGTSIVHAFYSLSGSDPRSIEQSLRWFAFTRRGGMGFVQNDAKLIRQGRYFFATSHLPNYIAHPPADGTFSFTALRDPVNRVVSLYRYLRSSHSDNGFVFGALDEERMWAKGSFGKFLDVLPRETLLNQLYMFSPSGSISETVEALGKLDLVIHTEDISCGIQMLEGLTGIRLVLGHERSSSSEPVVVSKEGLDRVRTMLEPEYEMLNQLGTIASNRDQPKNGH